MKRIGVFGGSFNPIHMGHIQAARQAAERLKLDRVILIPTGNPPHKLCPPLLDGGERLKMVELAVCSEPKLTVSDLELGRSGPSYTYETLEILGKAHSQAQLYFLVGGDMFLGIHEWKNAAEIFRSAVLVPLLRGSKGEAEAVQSQRERLEAQGARVEQAEEPVQEISSTQLRRLLAFGCGDEFLPPQVAQYIRSSGLYDTAAQWKGLPMEELEPIVVKLLNPNRVRHVLGCRDTCVELARHWGADETDAARAGILHDITKALDGPLQLTLCRAYGTVLDDFSIKYPKTLHALTGSLVAERIFGENERVVSAICSHTTGKRHMNLLETIVYVADYMEPNRSFPGVEKLRTLAFADLRAALKLGLEMTLEHLHNQGSEVSPETWNALDALKNGKD